MSRQYCNDCGCAMSGGYCTNCDEEVFIAEQYADLAGTEYQLDFPGPETEFRQRYDKSIAKREQTK